MSKQKSKSSPASEFHSSDKVRFRHGLMDLGYPDMPLGGWVGTIAEVHGNGMYTVRWSKETLAAVHPVFKGRCEKDGLEFDQYVLGADDLEHNAGGPLNIAQPKAIPTKPLSKTDQDDRIRMVFGLTSNDPLPDVDNETLEAYYQYLAQNLAFPFSAEHAVRSSSASQITVIGLGDPDDESMLDDSYGVLCERSAGRAGGDNSARNSQTREREGQSEVDRRSFLLVPQLVVAASKGVEHLYGHVQTED